MIRLRYGMGTFLMFLRDYRGIACAIIIKCVIVLSLLFYHNQKQPVDEKLLAAHQVLMRSYENFRFVNETVNGVYKEEYSKPLTYRKSKYLEQLKLFKAQDSSWYSDLANHFLQKVCALVEQEKMKGAACAWLCDKELDSERSFSFCPASQYHIMPDSLTLTCSTGATFAMSDEFFSQILTNSFEKTDLSVGSTESELEEYRKLLSETLNIYLNQGAHEQILNTMFNPSSRPISKSYVQSLNSLLKDKRWMLSVLFYGTGERSDEPPSFDTESVPAASMLNTCGGMYQYQNFVNNTTPFSSVFNHSASSSWTLGSAIKTFYLYQTVLHLLDLEESTAEHEYEGDFYLCHINSSQILLENACIRRNPTIYQQLDIQCTLKVLDISRMLYSKYEVEKHLSSLKCKSDKDCRFYSCEGNCDEGHCTITEHTRLSGLLQICHIIRAIEDQLLEGQNTVTRGHLFHLIDRCLDMRYLPHTVNGTSDHLYVEYNTVFQSLKLFIMDLQRKKQYVLIREAEAIAAKKEQ